MSRERFDVVRCRKLPEKAVDLSQGFLPRNREARVDRNPNGSDYTSFLPAGIQEKAKSRESTRRGAFILVVDAYGDDEILEALVGECSDQTQDVAEISTREAIKLETRRDIRRAHMLEVRIRDYESRSVRSKTDIPRVLKLRRVQSVSVEERKWFRGRRRRKRNACGDRLGRGTRVRLRNRIGGQCRA